MSNSRPPLQDAGARERQKPLRKLALVLPVHWSAAMGGSEYQVRCLLERLASLGGWSISYVTRLTDPLCEPAGYTIRAIGASGPFDFHRLYRDRRPLLRTLASIEPDIIYQRVGCAYTGIAAFYARRNSCRMVWHVAHGWDVKPFGREGLRTLPHSYLEKKFLEYGLRKSADIIVQTEDQAACLRRHYGREASRVVPNFHPPPAEEVDKSGALKVLWVANMKDWKHPEHFVRLAADLARSRADVSCLMIGRTYEEAGRREALERQIAAVPTLEHLGPLDIEEVNALLGRAHVLVNTSSEEGFANTFIQAWMRKVPVVSLHCNFDRVFEKHKVGFHSGSYGNLLRDVTALLDNRSLREEMGETAQRHAVAHHSMDNAGRIIELLER